MTKIEDYLKNTSVSAFADLQDKMSKVDFSNLSIPSLSTGTILPNPLLTNIPKPNYSLKISNKLEMMDKNANIREIDKVSNDLEWQNTELEELNNKLKSLTNAIDMRTSLLVFSIVTIIGVIIPFSLTLFSNYFNNEIGKMFLFTYLCLSFVVSLLLIFIYIFYSYKTTTSKNEKIENFGLYTGNKYIKSFKLHKNP